MPVPIQRRTTPNNESVEEYTLEVSLFLKKFNIGTGFVWEEEK
jgi:hypothetical protein